MPHRPDSPVRSFSASRPSGFQPLTRGIARVIAVALFPLATAAFAQNAAIVNNQPIPKEKLDHFVQMLITQGQQDTPQLRAAARDELIARELFAQEAARRKLDQGKEVQAQLADARQMIMIRAAIGDYLKEHPVTDEEIQAEYKRVAAQAGGGKEYRARHILVETEEEADGIIAQLKKGAKFEELAKQSKDTGSAQAGGDLDWNTPESFVPEFSEAMVALDKGKYTEKPVKSQFGYHIIRLDDVREVQPPPLDEVRPQIQQKLERDRVQQLQQDLRAKAKIE